jgi:hypothetical protein
MKDKATGTRAYVTETAKGRRNFNYFKGSGHLGGIPVNVERILQYILTYLGCGPDSMWSG